MSVIERMSIMGIRSFGPDDQHKQLIEFFKPLTLILGPNGSGKTTIIECLRYMTTGDVPPNSDRGSSFVHDPKIAGEMEIKGQIKLQIRDLLNKKMFATRNLHASQKQTKIQFKTLDGIITRISDSGEKLTLSSKCAEIDKEMISALGISKPILTNVIFCHQEESNWPLSDSKSLKQKFDDIFAATRYIKASEEIKKIRNEKVNDIKIFKSQVEGLKDNKRKAAEFTKKLEETKSRLAASKSAISDIDNKLKPVTDKLQEIADKEHEIGRLQSSLESNNKVLEKLKKDEMDMKNSIKDLFSGSKEELEEEMNNFNALIVQKRKQLEKVKRQCLEVESGQKELQRKKSKLQEEVGKLKAEHKIHRGNIATRNAKLRELSLQLGLGELSSEFDEESIQDSQIENVMRNWNRKLAKTQQELKDAKTSFDSQENDIQSQIDKVRDEKAQKSQKQKSCAEKIKKNKEVLRDIDTELSQVDFLVNRQDDLKDDLKQAEEELEMMEKRVNVNSLRAKISEQQMRKKDMEIKLSTLNDEMRQVQKESKTRTEIELTSKEKISKQEAVDKMLNRHKDTIIHLLGNMPEKNAQDSVKSFLTTVNHDIREKNKEMKTQQSQLASFEATKKHYEQQLKEKEELVKSHRNKIFKVCGDQNFDSGLDNLEKTVKTLQDDKASLNASLHWYDKYIEKLNARKPCCPLCKRSFTEENEAGNLKNDLQKKLENVPSQLKEKEKLLAEHQKRLNTMLQLKPLKQDLNQFLNTEIPELKKKICKLDEDIEKLINDIADLEDVLDSRHCDAKTATDMLPDLAMLDQNQRDLLRIERRLSTLTCQLGSSDASRTVQVVGDEYAAAFKDIESVRNIIESAQLKISEHNEQVQRFRGRINDLRAEQVEIAGRLQKKNALEEQLATLSAENREFTDLIKEINSELVVLEKKIKELTSEKTNFLRKKEMELEKIRKKIATDEREKDSIDSIMKEIERYIKAEREKKLHEQESAISVIDSNIQDKANELLSRNKDKDSLNEMITSQQMKFREYEDNLKLMQINLEMKSLKSKCSQLQESIGDFDIRTILREKRKLMEQEKELTRERNSHEGRQSELVQQISHFEEQLRDKAYRDADKKYNDMMIELRTTELVCDDLNKYYIALDNAVMKYHQMKMNEINKIIRTLWMQTYMGNDIDYIEIRSNQDTEVGLAKGRRIYNYKVVLMKGETPVDMRGRCSAGQKVLASLIIRLALAETFCLNCGILALDEPTTNLDRDNIISLARALVEIVKSRSEQRNFQLIVITHDEDFIGSLGHSDVVDYFYKIHKDNNAYSRISKCRVSDI